MWQPLLANLAVMAMGLIAWNAFAERIEALAPALRSILFGLAMASGVVASMAMAFEVGGGVFIDLRNPLIVISALFGGLPAAVLTAGVAMVYRLYLGGAVLFGLGGIFAAMGIGLLIRRLSPKGVACVRCLTAAAAVSATTTAFVTMMMRNADWAINASQITAFGVISFVATMTLGGVLLWEAERRKLYERHRQFKAMVDALPDCLNVKDLQGRFVAANPATARLMNAASVDELIGKTDADFYPAAMAKAFREDELQVLCSGVPATIEQQGRRPDGTSAWLATLKAPAFDERGTLVGLVTSNRDITERRVLQDQLATAQSYLDQALQNMNDGLAIYDRDGVLLFANDRYRELFARTGYLRVAGSRFEAIISASIALGEEELPDGVTSAEHAKERFDDLFRDGEYLIRKPDGDVYASRTKVLENGAALRIISDVTERLNHERALEHQALHDPLTGLPNRAYFNREIERLLARAEKNGEELVVMLLDLDRFKEVNDSFGHAAGDALLVEVAHRLAGAARRGDFVARLGGDEFVVLGSGHTNGLGDVSMATRILKSLSKPMNFGGVTLLPGATIGYTVWPRDSSGCEDLLKHADMALYQAKARRRGTFRAYNAGTAATRGKARA